MIDAAEELSRILASELDKAIARELHDKYIKPIKEKVKKRDRKFNKISMNNLDECFDRNATLNDVCEIEGLIYVPNFLDNLTARKIISKINEQEWSTDLKRRVQHYGYKYDYKSRSIDSSMFLGSLPDWTGEITSSLFRDNYLNKVPDQLIINEYLPGQGITNHIDCKPCFDNAIASISLGSSCIMDFINIETKQKSHILLEPNSLLILKNDARYKYTHGISARKTDIFKSVKMKRSTRISLTFRNVIL